MSTATVALERYSFKPANALNASAAAKRKILADARLGNGDAFAEMVLPYAPGLYRRALRLTGNAADAEDARQEALLKAFSRLSQFAGQQDEGKDDLHAWVSRITTNASIDLIRQRREGKYISLEEPGFAPEETLGARLPARTDNPEELYARRESRALIAGAIARLAPDLRQICLLRDVLQYSTHEVAARLGNFNGGSAPPSISRPQKAPRNSSRPHAAEATACRLARSASAAGKSWQVKTAR